MSKSEIIEEWRDITGYEGLYQVSNLGRVRSLDRYVNSGYNTKRFSKGKILSFLLQKNGYAKVMLSKENTVKNADLHRLVAETFIANPNNKTTVNHKDGNKENNKIDNLEWATQKENNNHAAANGLNLFLKKLSVDQIKKMRKEYIPYSRKFGAVALSKKYNCSINTARLIVEGKRYKSIK